MKELFLVEGKSAASTVRQAMSQQSQEVLALQGKILNVRTASKARVESNPVCARLFTALGCGIGDQCKPDQLRFSKVVLLTDPDVDGAHSRALLAALFARYLAPLVRDGRIFAVIPPLWRVRYSDSSNCVYAWDKQELDTLTGNNNSSRCDRTTVELNTESTRFRGVAQFSKEECVKLMLSPNTRRQVQLTMGEE